MRGRRQVSDAQATRTYALRLAKSIAKEHGLPWPSCYANETHESDALRFEMSRRLRRELKLTPVERDILIRELT